MEELERKVTGSDSVIVEEPRSAQALPDHVGEDVRNVLPEMGCHCYGNCRSNREG